MHLPRFTPHALALLLAAACGGFQPPRIPDQPLDVQGHRGARGLLPENTLPAFGQALELGVSTLELDLGVTRDRQVVVSHDSRINPKICRRGDGTAILTPPLLRELSLAEVQALDCGGLNPNRRRFPEPPRRNVAGARIPTLGQVFDLAAAGGDDEVRFNVEIKVDPKVDDTLPLEEFVALVVDLVRDRGLGPRVTVQSFDWRALELVKQRDPGLETAALLAADTLEPEWLNGVDPAAVGGTALDLLRSASAYVDVFSPHWRLVLPGAPGYLGSTVREIQAAGFRVVPWTVNDRRRMKKVLALGVEGLITDYPDVLIELLEDEGIAVR